MEDRLRDVIVAALRAVWAGRGYGYPKSGEVLAKMLEQGAEAPPPRAILRELRAMDAERLIKLSADQALDGEAVRAHGAVVITWVHPDLLPQKRRVWRIKCADLDPYVRKL